MTESVWTTFGKTSGGGGSGGNFLRPSKLKDKQSVKFRILGSPIEGFERWTTENKPVSIALGEPWPAGHEWRPGKEGNPKMFASMPVWNYAEEAVQVLTFTQATIREQLSSWATHEEWGDPTGYDLTLKRTGTTKEDTKYALVPSLPKPCPEVAVAAWDAVLKSGFDLNELFTGGNPFAPAAKDDDIGF